ncbi:MAG: hypothetical protein ACI9EW_001974 [Cellvibrionaceae bacterium]|jgi:hypothetical protein
MRPLKKALQDHELIVLRVIGEWWEMDLTGQDKPHCVATLSAEMPHLDIPQELIYLSSNEADAVKALVRAKGRMPKAAFTRQFGEVRQMGPGALEREEPWLDPQTAAEDLWYRGLIFAGIDRDDPTIEYIYLPEEFFGMFDPATLDQETEPNGQQETNDIDDPIELVEGPEDSNFEDIPPPTALKKKKTSLKGVGRSIPDELLLGNLSKEIWPETPKLEIKVQEEVVQEEVKEPAKAPARKKPIKINRPKKKIEPDAEVEAEAYVDIDSEVVPDYDEGSSETEEETGVPRQSIEEQPMEPEPGWATEKLPVDKSMVAAATKPAQKPKQNSRLNKKEPLTNKEPDNWTPATTYAVDDFTTLLILAQTDRLQDGQTSQIKPYLLNQDENRLNMLLSIGVSLLYFKRVSGGYRPTKATVGWLQKGREAQLQELAAGWLNCGWNELRHVPTLSCEGSNWSNDPTMARRVLLDGVTFDEQWGPYTLVAQRIKKEKPDFQRPNGNYDLWYIRDLATGEYVSGFENWDLVEGRLLHYLIENPLNWLGMSEVGHEKFRLTERAHAWINEEASAETEQPEPLTLSNNGLLQLPASVDRYKRFQAGRFADLQPISDDGPNDTNVNNSATDGKTFSYRVTPVSLQRAQDVGIESSRVLQFLQQASADGEVPAGLKRAIQRWSENGVEGMVEQTVILRVKEPKIMETLRGRPETRPFLAESLSDTVVVIMPGKWGELCQAAAQLGLLLEPIGLG